MFADADSANSAEGRIAPVERNLGRRLLVQDGASAFQTLTREVGEALGYQVEVTSSVREFLRMYDSFEPSVIVYDFFSQDMDGFELVNWLDARDSSARVVLTSSRESFFLRAARDLATARGRLDIDVMVEPISRADVSNMLARRSAVSGANPRGC